MTPAIGDFCKAVQLMGKHPLGVNYPKRFEHYNKAFIAAATIYVNYYSFTSIIFFDNILATFGH